MKFFRMGLEQFVQSWDRHYGLFPAHTKKTRGTLLEVEYNADGLELTDLIWGAGSRHLLHLDVHTLEHVNEFRNCAPRQ